MTTVDALSVRIFADGADCCAAKFGVYGLAQSLAEGLEPRAIRVSANRRVYVQTDCVRDALLDSVGGILPR